MATLKSKAEAILAEKTNKIVPENIKQGVTIFDVEGTLSGSGDVKLFETVEQMQQDQNPQEGDLAVVYREEIQPITEESKFDSCIFPQTVILDEAFTGSISGRFRSTGSSYFNGDVNMSSSNFRFSGNISITYTSSDGITYTRTDGGKELQEFGTAIKWNNSYGDFNDVIGNFMKIGENYFEGLFNYELDYIHTDTIIPVSGFTYTDNNIEPINTNLLINTKNVDIFNKAIEACKEYESITSSNNLGTIFCNNDISHIYIYTVNEFSVTNSQIIFDSTGTLYIVLRDDMRVAGYDYDINSKIVTPVTLTQTTFIGPNNYNMIAWSGLIGNFIGNYYNNKFRNTQITYRENVTDNTNIQNLSFINHFKNNEYVLIPTQLNATADYVYEKTFYGKNGVEVGTLVNTIANDFSDRSAEIYEKIQLYYDKLEPLVITDSNKSIVKNATIIPTKSDGTVLFDTSGVTNMSNMFRDRDDLAILPLIDTSNVTNMSCMLWGCELLTEIPLFDTGNVTSMNYMFCKCTALTEIPLLDLSSCTNIDSMFSGCSALTELPLLDTSNVTSMNNLFQGCLALETIPILDTSNASGISAFVSGCGSLSNESLNNVMKMCINATNFTWNKTLRHIGITQEQTVTCQSLSNYQDLINAGWTTGY